MTAITATAPRIYVGSLSDYNAGILHGRWIDATLGVEHIWEETQAMLRESPAVRRGDTFGCPAEEWAIHDYEGFGGHRLSEYESFENVAKLAEAIKEYGDAFLAYLSTGTYSDADGFIDSFEEAYVASGVESERDYAMEYVSEVGWGGIAGGPVYEVTGAFGSHEKIDVIEELAGYLDWDAIVRDLFDHGDHTFVDGHVFREVR